MFDKVLEFFSIEHHNQEQREAIIDLLNLLTLIDNKVKLKEQDYIDRFIEDLPWDSGTAKETYLSMSIAKVREALDKDQVEAIIDNITRHIHSREFKDKALQMASTIALVDGNMSEKESNALEMLKEKLN